jgi:hypothetical protein
MQNIKFYKIKKSFGRPKVAIEQAKKQQVSKSRFAATLQM